LGGLFGRYLPDLLPPDQALALGRFVAHCDDPCLVLVRNAVLVVLDCVDELGVDDLGVRGKLTALDEDEDLVVVSE